MIQRSTKNILELGKYRNSHTYTSWSKCMTCISLSLVFDLAKHVAQVCINFIPTQNSTKKPLVGWKESKTSKFLGEVLYTLSDRVNHLRNLYFFTKLIKPLDRRLIKEWMICDSVIIILSCNRPWTWKSYKPHKDQGKGWIKMPTYLNYGRILRYRHGTYEIYSAL
jgi:hypothetical protein